MTENEKAQNLSNSQLRFPKLEELYVLHCNKLKCLFSLSTSIMLPELKNLYISEAAQLENAFRYINEVGANIMEKIMVPKLRSVYLEQLPNFLDISQGLKVHVMELSVITIIECPKFGPILAEKIPLHPWRTEAVSVTYGQVSNEGPYLQLTSFVKEEQQEIIASNIIQLFLKNLSDLMFLWNGPNLISFQNLSFLEVVGCSKLKSLFSDATIMSVPELLSLKIEDCEELEEIISSSALGGECHCRFSLESCSQQVVCFPSLFYVRVSSCNNMKFLFPHSMAEHLQRLQYLEITEVYQLEYIFSCGRETHDDHDGDVVKLPRLADLKISEVPRFKYIVCGGLQSQLHFPNLKEEYRQHLLLPRKDHNPGDEYEMDPCAPDEYDGSSMIMNNDSMEIIDD